MNELPRMVTWLDPGLTTGWATLCNNGRTFESGQAQMVDVGGYLEGSASLYMGDMAIGWEQYIVTPGGGRGGTAGPPLEVIGMAKWIGYWHSCQMLKPVPSAMRTVATADMLKRLGWYRPGRDHAMQAARHLLAWLIREKLLSSEQYELVFGECQTLVEE